MAEARQASKEQQDEYDRAVTAAVEILYSEETNAQIMQRLQTGASDPMSTVVDVASIIIKEVRAAGVAVEEDVLRGALQEIIMLIAELASQAGLFDFPQDQIASAIDMVVSSIGAGGQGAQQPQQQQPAQQPQQQGIIGGAMGNG
jgi:hypothetical protein